MNRNGVFCFLIVLAFVGMQLDSLNGRIAAMQQLEGAKATAIEAEQLHAIRTAIEINADMAIEETLGAGLLQNQEPGEIRKAVNGKLLQFFNAVEGAYMGSVGINFYAGGSAVSMQFLEENSKVNVSRLDNQSIAAEYSFTGGLLRNNEVIGEIHGEKAWQAFKIPVGYTVRATVVG